MIQPVLLFPGQGSQEPGMGRDLAEASPEAMDLWKLAERVSGLPLREIYWDGDEAAMSDTRALQPALTVVNCNLWREMAGRVSPRGAAGHSLGEFSALAAAGVLTPESVLEITALRGRLMAEADPQSKGGMAALLKLDEARVAEIVAEAAAESGELLLTANYNTPAQLVVSGAKNAVALACQKAKERKGRGIELKVSGAFHSPMMEEANRELTPLLRKAVWQKPRFPVYCNLHGKAVHDGESARDSLLQQMVSPVRWIETVRNQYQDGARFWLELGPKAVLGKMVAPCLSGIAAEDADTRVELVSNLESVRAFSL
ncbi:ACP S-malonyltransferase [Desulfovibrio porci]|uniref:ACP S-malonyltransferase n=1 Tax=Desulfovibrio porci TaxID=2605782 RepID=UPI002A7F8322|nr:ACP S-malonyltransferase [Desulfovibrio porci]MDY3808891.1 ACP S-malonyltransferase [Desulfovibrio porci]